MFLRLNLKNWDAGRINGCPTCFPAHEGHYRRFVHEAQFPLRSVLFWIWMIDNGRIHEHAAVRQNSMKISSQSAEVSECILTFILRDPFLNMLSIGAAV